ncbi:MAG: efflux RND transporter permease subunit [Flavobacteriales bacterium]
MGALIRYFVRYNLVGDLVMLAILAAGWVGLGSTRSNFFPVTESKTIQIQVVYPGASPAEVEEGIVAKIEENLQGIAGLDQVKSVCSENAGSITVTVLDAGETDEILQDVKNAVDRIASFPVGMEPPTVFKQEAIGVAITFAVTGVDDLRALKTEARRIEQDLRALDGISQVALSGFPGEEIEVAIRADKLTELNMTLAEVSAAIRAANVETTGGRLKTAREELIVRGRFRGYDAEALEDIVIRSNVDGRVVRLSDVAVVQDRWADNDPSRSWYNGMPSVVVTVNNLTTESILDVTELVRQYIEAYNLQAEEVGTGLKLDIIRDSSVVLNQRIELLVNNGVVGFLLVILLLALFLNIRLAFWVALAIPVSFAGMFIFAGMTGVTINVISLFGMILVIGILVDDGIVIAENIYRHFEMGKDRHTATIEGTLEVLPAVFSAIVTTIVAFASFFFIEGRLGDFFGDMATVIMLTLLFSLVEGAFILPAHVGHSKALRRDWKPNRVERTMRTLMDFLKSKLYAPVLRFAMAQPWITFSGIVALFLITVPGLIGSGLVKTTFFPFIESDNLTVSLSMVSGTRDEVTASELDAIEAKVWEVNAALKAEREDGQDVILAVDKRVGPAAHVGSINIQLLDGEQRGVRSTDISARIREKVGTVYGAENLSFAGFSPFGRPVSVSLLGNDLDALQAATEELKAAMMQREDLKDVTDNNQRGLQELDVLPKPRAQQLGLTAGDLMLQIRQGFFGNEVQRLQRGRDEVRVWVRLAEADRSALSDLRRYRIRTPAGGLVPLEELAEVREVQGITAINRLYGEREVQVSADLSGPDVSASDANADLKVNVIPGILAKYPAIRASYEGQNREQAKSQVSIQAIMPLIFALMLFIIILTFRSPLQGFAVFGLIPFGMIGISLGHWLLGAQISLFSILGMIALIGILVNDALVFVAAYNGNLKEGMPVHDAIWEAGMSRFRPILLTTVTTVAGLAPLMLNKSFQAQFLIPMAISVAFGLLFVTVVILVLLPIYLMWINPLHRSWVWVKKGDWLSRESAEPAVREERGFAPNTLPVLALGFMAWGLSADASAQTDLTREEAVTMALEQHYGIQLAQGQRDLAEVGNAWGAAGALPRLALTAGVGTNVTDQTENPSTFLPIATESQSVSPGLQVQWTLFDGMAMFANKDRLVLLTEQAEGNVELMVESTVQAVLTAYDNVLVQEESLVVLQATMDLTQERLARLDASLALGTARTFDRLQFENALLTDSAAWLRQSVASRAARRNLNLLLAAPDDQAWTLTSALLDPNTTGDMASAQARLAGKNTSVSNAVLAMQLAEVGVQQAKARLSPVLGLTANWGNTAGQSRAVSDLPPQLVFNPYENGDIQSFVTNYGAQLTLNFNLFNGGATRRAIQQAQIQVELAGLDRDRLLLEAQSALAQAWDRRAAAQELHELAQRRTENARLAAQLGADRYRDGILNALDFRALDVALLQAEAAELAARQEWAAAHWDVMRLTGDLRAGQVVVR